MPQIVTVLPYIVLYGGAILGAVLVTKDIKNLKREEKKEKKEKRNAFYEGNKSWFE